MKQTPGFSSLFMSQFLDALIQKPKRLLSPLFLMVMRCFPQRFSRHYDAWVMQNNLAYEEPLCAGLRMVRKEPERILDLCTGTGKAAFVAAEAFPQATVIGVDHSMGMLEIAAEKAYFSNVSNVAFAHDDALTLDFDDATFDMIMVSNAPVYLEEAVRVLKPEGTLLAAFSFGGDAFVKNKGDLRALVEENDMVFMAMSHVAQGVFILAEKRPAL